jgi:hypothetical protein
LSRRIYNIFRKILRDKTLVNGLGVILRESHYFDPPWWESRNFPARPAPEVHFSNGKLLA